mgnify:CR=1 FL=1
MFIDWHDMDKMGDMCCVQMLYGKALECMAEFANICGKTGDAEYYASIYGKLAEKINEYYWNGKAYVSVLKEGVPSDQVRRHQNYFAVLFGYADEEKTKSIIENVLFNDEIPYITTPFFKFFEYDVLFKCGYFEKAFDVMKAERISIPVFAASEQSLAPSRMNSPFLRRKDGLSPSFTAYLIFSFVRAVIFSINLIP